MRLLYAIFVLYKNSKNMSNTINIVRKVYQRFNAESTYSMNEMKAWISSLKQFTDTEDEDIRSIENFFYDKNGPTFELRFIYMMVFVKLLKHYCENNSCILNVDNCYMVLEQVQLLKDKLQNPFIHYNDDSCLAIASPLISYRLGLHSGTNFNKLFTEEFWKNQIYKSEHIFDVISEVRYDSKSRHEFIALISNIEQDRIDVKYIQFAEGLILTSGSSGCVQCAPLIEEEKGITINNFLHNMFSKQ